MTKTKGSIKGHTQYFTNSIYPNNSAKNSNLYELCEIGDMKRLFNTKVNLRFYINNLI